MKPIRCSKSSSARASNAEFVVGHFQSRYPVDVVSEFGQHCPPWLLAPPTPKGSCRCWSTPTADRSCMTRMMSVRRAPDGVWSRRHRLFQGTTPMIVQSRSGNRVGIILFLLPVMTLFVLYFVYPLGFVFVTSTLDWNGISTPEFVGPATFWTTSAIVRFRYRCATTLCGSSPWVSFRSGWRRWWRSSWRAGPVGGGSCARCTSCPT